jgi:excisionase family DNA binding protein
MTREVGIKRAIIDGTEVTSFLDPALPFPDESLLGFFTRVADDHVFHSTLGAFQKVGIRTIYLQGLALRHPDAMERLAFGLKVPPSEIERRMYRLAVPGMIDFFGTTIRKVCYEPSIRRVSPRALAIAPYYRAIWDIRVFNFCPETKELLLDHCPICERPLGWRYTHGVAFCEKCVDQWQRPAVDLRAFPQPLIDVDDIAGLEFVCDLIHPLKERKSQARKALRHPFTRFSNGELFEFAVALASAESTDLWTKKNLGRPKSKKDYDRYMPDVIARAGRAILDWPKGFHAIASRVREKAHQRSGFFGVQKELGPLTAICREKIISGGLRRLIQSEIKENMRATENISPVVRRPSYRSAALITTLDARYKYGVDPNALRRLSASGSVTTFSSQGVKRSWLLFVQSELDALMKVRASVEPERSVAVRLGIPAGALPELAKRGLIKGVTGPVEVLFGGRRCYDKVSVDTLIDSVKLLRRESMPKTAVCIARTVNRSGFIGPKPWARIIESILDKKIRVWHLPSCRIGLMKNTAVEDGPVIISILAKQCSLPNVSAGADYITFREAADLIGSSEVLVADLVRARQLPAADGKHWRIKRADVFTFISEKILTTEIAALLGTDFASVRSRLAALGVIPVACVRKNRGFVWCRAQVEDLLPSLRDGC